MHEFKVNDYVRWKKYGSVYTGKIKTVNKATVNIACEYDMTERVPKDKLTYLPPVRINAEEYRAVLRLERDLLALTEDNALDNTVNTDGYRIRVEDILYALRSIIDSDADEESMDAWCRFVWQELYVRDAADNSGIYSESDALRSMLGYIYHPRGGFDSEQIPEAIEEGRKFAEDRNKHPFERRYPLYIKERIIRELGTDAAMNAASEEKITLYRMFSEELAGVTNKSGLHAVGYGCYGGNRAFACDWKRSEACITKLFELEDRMPQKAFYANTLGYIYYYGRSNGGTRDYERAYRYFSFAAFNGVYEARYKIADMYDNGYGVFKSPETARNIVSELYDENIEYIRNGEFDCKFADIALRMGNISIADRKYEQALYYYSQAEFAIRMRMMEGDHYGDSGVCETIRAEIEKTKEILRYKPKRQVSYLSLYSLLEGEITGGRRLDLVIRRKQGSKYTMTFSAHKLPGEDRERKMFLTETKVDMCGLFSKLVLTYEPRAEIDEQLLDRTLTVDGIAYGGIFCDGKILHLTGGRFVLKYGKTSDKKTYRFVSVRFEGEKLYDYLCDDLSIGVEDTVTVNAAGEEKRVVVMRVYEKKECETSLPLGYYKRVLNKV